MAGLMLFLSVSQRVFLDESSICSGGLSKADATGGGHCPIHRGPE